jgi:hypothetical protein
MAVSSSSNALPELSKVGFLEHENNGHDKTILVATFWGLPGTPEPQEDEDVLPRLCPRMDNSYLDPLAPFERAPSDSHGSVRTGW